MQELKPLRLLGLWRQPRVVKVNVINNELKVVICFK